MSDAEIIAQLRQVDAEKAALLDEILELEEKVEKHLYDGCVSLAITGADNVKYDYFEFSIAGDLSTAQRFNENHPRAKFNLHDKSTVIVVSFSIPEDNSHVPEEQDIVKEDEPKEASAEDDGDNADDFKDAKETASPPLVTSVHYRGLLDCEILPSDTFIVLEIEAVSDDGTISKVGLKASYEKFEETLRSKQLQLKQLENAVADLKESSKRQLETSKLRKELTPKKNTGAGAKGKKSKKGVSDSSTSSGAKGRSRRTPTLGGDDSDDVGGPSDETAASGMFSSENLQNVAAASLGVIIQQRAYILFPVAAMLIYAYGDYASV